MIVKFFNRGKGGGNGPVDYLLGKDRERELAKLDQGDPDEIINLINSCEFTQKYKSGCLSFSEKDLPQSHKDKIMADFEKVLLPGLDKNQYSILWVEHKDKDRLELNFVVPCVELTTAKRLQPYYHKIDEKRVDTWKRIVNASLNLHDPDAPKNKRAVMDLNVTNLPQDKKLQCNQISTALLNQVEIGLVKNRSDLVRVLEGAGFSITRQAKNTLSIKDPNGGKNIKLKGEIYESTFQFSREHASRVRTAQADYEATKPSELERNNAELQRLLGKKSEANRSLYLRARKDLGKNGVELSALAASVGGRSAGTDRFSDQLSNIQDSEIQRSHSLNNGGIHRRDGGHIVVDGAEHNRTTSDNKNPKITGGEYRDINMWGAESPLREDRFRTEKIRNGRGLPVDDTRGVLNDRARKTLIERIGEIIGRSGNNVSRVQNFFRAVGRETASATKVLRDFTGRKSKSDSVSNELDRASERFNESAKQIVKVVEKKLEQDRNPTFGPKFF